MKLTIHGYSTALFATWYFIEELGLLFDAGDGLTSNLLGKTGKIKNVFISHADRDHLGGLLQYNQLFANRNPNIYYPKDSGSFKHLESFTTQFDPHTAGTNWISLNNNETVQIKNNFNVTCFENQHIDIKGQLKSLSYKVLQRKKKLKIEFQGLSSQEIIAIKKAKGSDFINEEINKSVLLYSGDTPVYDYSKYDDCGILIHEATFLKRQEVEKGNHKNKHSSLEEVLEMIANIKVDKLILGHFSSRYDMHQIDEEIEKLIKYYNIKIPIYRIPIGEMEKDILSGKAIN
jgi:ribonuclease Z